MCDHYDAYHRDEPRIIQKLYKVKPQFERAVIELRSHFTVKIEKTPIVITEDEDIGKHLKRLGLFDEFCEEVREKVEAL